MLGFENALGSLVLAALKAHRPQPASGDCRPPGHGA
jgi:hypothetical protein